MDSSFWFALFGLIAISIYCADGHIQHHVALLKIRQRMREIKAADELLDGIEDWGNRLTLNPIATHKEKPNAHD